MNSKHPLVVGIKEHKLMQLCQAALKKAVSNDVKIRSFIV